VGRRGRQSGRTVEISVSAFEPEFITLPEAASSAFTAMYVGPRRRRNEAAPDFDADAVVSSNVSCVPCSR